MINTYRFQQDQAQAKKFLSHYISRVWVEAGLPWSFDNDTEIETLVDDLMAPALDLIRELDQRITKLENKHG